MPGQKRMREIFAALTANEDEVWEAIAEGRYVKDVAHEFGAGASRASFYRWVNDGGDERRDRRIAAMEQRGDSFAEDAGKVLDDAAKEATLTTAHASVAKEQSKHKRWLAGKFNERYADSPQVAVNVQSVGDLHLQALIGGGLVEIETGKREQVEEADYELIEGSGEEAVSRANQPTSFDAADFPESLDAVDAVDEFEADMTLARPQCMTTYDAGLQSGPPKVVAHEGEPTKLVRMGKSAEFVEVGESILKDLLEG